MVAAFRRSVAVQAVVLALVLLAGLARVVTYEPDTASLRELGSVAAAARAASTVRVAIAVTVRRTGGAPPSATTGAGAIDFARGLSTFTYEGGSGGGLTVISDDTTVWTKVPASRVASNGGKHWVAFPASERAPQPEDSLDALAALTGRTPRAHGHEDVGGYRTTRYTLRIGLRDLAARLGGKAGALFETGIGYLGDGTAAFAVYVDESGLPRRLTLAIRVARLAEDITFDYYDYGRPVGVAPPPAADVVTAKTAEELLSRLGTASP